MEPLWIIAPVLVPLLAAPIIALIGHARLGWLLALAASLGSSVAAVLLCLATLEGPLQYSFGNWPAPFGIEYVLDGLNTPLLLISSVAAFLCLLACPPGTLRGAFGERHATFYTLFALCLTGLNGILATGDAFNVFVFLEISSLSTYGLVASGSRPGAALAAFQYLVLGTLGGSFVLLGVGLWYQASGTLNMADLAVRLPASPYAAVVFGGTVLLIFGFALKAASFPVHQWLPAVYAAAPWPVTAFLAACATKVAIYALVRLGLFVGDLDQSSRDWLGLIALAGILWGAICATAQSDLRRLLAWSSVSQLAYIVFAFSLGTAAGVVAAMTQFLGHAAIKGGLFLSLGPATRLQDLAGMRQTDPWRCALVTLLALGLLGAPLTAGFAAKWALLSATWASAHTLGLVVIVLSSLLAVVYCLRLIEPIWLQDAEAAERPLPTLAWSNAAPPVLAAALMLLIGCTTWASTLGQSAARAVGLS